QSNHLRYFIFFSTLIPHPLSSTLFPYTTLFRSVSSRRVINAASEAFFASVTLLSRSFISPGRMTSRIPSAKTSTPSSTARFLRRSEEHTSELQSQSNLVCRLLLEKKKKNQDTPT